MNRFLVETALLTHGLVSVSNERIQDMWPGGDIPLVWVDRGRICLGNMAEFLPFRRRANSLCRIDCFSLERAQEEGSSGALTASGTMAVCARMGIPLAVSCGIGGMCDIRGEELCPDLPALRDLPVTLLATSFKDMMDIPATHRWLAKNDVPVFGAGTDRCTGYLFSGVDLPVTPMSGNFRPEAKCLLLNAIPTEERIRDLSLLEMGIAEGKMAEARGGYYHPAANAAFDRMTAGASSRMQLRSLIANVLLAQKLTKA